MLWLQPCTGMYTRVSCEHQQRRRHTHTHTRGARPCAAGQQARRGGALVPQCRAAPHGGRTDAPQVATCCNGLPPTTNGCRTRPAASSRLNAAALPCPALPRPRPTAAAALRAPPPHAGRATPSARHPRRHRQDQDAPLQHSTGAVSQNCRARCGRHDTRALTASQAPTDRRTDTHTHTSQRVSAPWCPQASRALRAPR